MKESSITHQGVVDSISDTTIRVKITNMSACSSCHAKGACNAADMQEKIIDAVPNGKEYKTGQAVTISANESMGFKALFLGYLLPFIIVLITLIILTAFSVRESLAGLISLAVLIPYYTGLYFNRENIKKSFIFEIKQ